MSLHGIDISYAQPTVPDLSPYSFVFARATYGGSGIDSEWLRNSSAVRSAGRVLGAYHFWYDGASGAAQASHFLSVASHADLLVLDYEGAATDAAGAQAFIRAIQNAGRKVGLYHSLSGYPSWGQDYRWIAAWGYSSLTVPWTFWQYGSSPAGSDADLFAGDATALAALAGTTTATLGGIDIMGLSLTLPASAVAGTLAIPGGCDSIRVSDGTHYKVPLGVTRPAVVAALTGTATESGWLCDLDGDTLHFIRASSGAIFTPTSLSAPAETVLAPGHYQVA